MNSYLLHFATYTFAMIGFIAVALFVYKKAMYTSSKSVDKDFLQVENSLKLSATKNIYVIKAGNEKFLIAGDTANTTMLAKLENNEKVEETVLKNKLTGFSSESKQLQKINRG